MIDSKKIVLDQNKVLLERLTQYFYDNKKHYDTFKSIVNKQSIISLRILDFFVTTYAQKYKTIIPDTQYIIYQEYKNQLKGYYKIKFDAFSRKYKKDAYKKFLFKHPNGNIETTIGQLNFFRWALSNGIVEYLERHYNQVVSQLSTYKHKNNIIPHTQLILK